MDFYIFSDTDLSGKTEWKHVFFSIPRFSPTVQNRFVKMHPCLVLPEYDYYVYVDGNIEIIGDVRDLVRTANEDFSFVVGMYEHPFRNCIYSEGAACIKHSRDWFWRIGRQLRQYFRAGYPISNGLYEAGVILIRNSPQSAEFLRNWWLEYLSGSARDQISLPYVAWTLGLEITSLGRSDFRFVHKYFRL
ncbi:MAG: glycosyltransferase domain-containing protein, partial [Flammeovirgaceae bacterium]